MTLERVQAELTAADHEGQVRAEWRIVAKRTAATAAGHAGAGQDAGGPIHVRGLRRRGPHRRTATAAVRPSLVATPDANQCARTRDDPAAHHRPGLHRALEDEAALAEVFRAFGAVVRPSHGRACLSETPLTILHSYLSVQNIIRGV